MKTHKYSLLKFGLATAMALAALLPGRLSAEDKPMKPMKGAEHLTMLNQIETKEQADQLSKKDSIAMVCAKCKTVYVTRVKQGVKGAQILNERGLLNELIGTHACGGCNSTLEITGHRVDKKEVLKHSCESCGDDSAFCCATKGGGGSTKGMEK